MHCSNESFLGCLNNDLENYYTRENSSDYEDNYLSPTHYTEDVVN